MKFSKKSKSKLQAKTRDPCTVHSVYKVRGKLYLTRKFVENQAY